MYLNVRGSVRLSTSEHDVAVAPHLVPAQDLKTPSQTTPGAAFSKDVPYGSELITALAGRPVQLGQASAPDV